MVNTDVTAWLVNCSEPILTGADGGIHTFTGNGNYVFNFTDLLGNAGSATATVNNIDKSPFMVSYNYLPAQVHSGIVRVVATLENTTGGVTPSGWTASGVNQYFQDFS